MSNMIDSIKYDEYVKNKIDHDCTRNQITIDENSSKLVTLYNLEKETVGHVIDLKCPGAYTISIMGKNQIPETKGTDYAHSMIIHLADDEDVEIDSSTTVEVYVEKVTEERTLVARMKYSDVCIKNEMRENKDPSDWYRFEESIEFMHEDHLVIYVINPNVNIDFRKTKFALDIDIWENDFYYTGKSKQLVKDDYYFILLEGEYPKQGAAIEHIRQGYRKFFDELKGYVDNSHGTPFDKRNKLLENFKRVSKCDEDTPIEIVKLSNSTWLEIYKESGYAIEDIIIAERVREGIVTQYKKGIEYYKGLNKRYNELKNNEELANHIQFNILTSELEELERKLGCAKTRTTYGENASCFNML